MSRKPEPTSTVGRAAREAARIRINTTRPERKPKLVTVHIIEYRVEPAIESGRDGRALDEVIDYLREYGSAAVIDTETIEGEL